MVSHVARKEACRPLSRAPGIHPRPSARGYRALPVSIAVECRCEQVDHLLRPAPHIVRRESQAKPPRQILGPANGRGMLRLSLAGRVSIERTRSQMPPEFDARDSSIAQFLVSGFLFFPSGWLLAPGGPAGLRWGGRVGERSLDSRYLSRVHRGMVGGRETGRS